MTNETTPRPPKAYVGNGKRLRAEYQDSPVAFYINVDVLLEHMANGRAQVFTSQKGRSAKLLLYTNREPDRYGNTHAVALDDYVAPPRPAAGTAPGHQANNEDLPW